MATVKGDVHDIGKNIVGVVLACNGYRIVDLGVMVPWTKILETAREENADAIGLSGLITPSLEEMRTVAQEMEREGMTLPLLIGGATTSRAHTAVRSSPRTPARSCTCRTRRARWASFARCSTRTRATTSWTQTRDAYAELRRQFAERDDRSSALTLDEARANRLRLDWATRAGQAQRSSGTRALRDFRLEELRRYIDWTPFFAAWELPGHYPEIFEDARLGEAAASLFNDAQAMLDARRRRAAASANAVVGFWPANATPDDDIVLYTDESRTPSSNACTPCASRWPSRRVGRTWPCRTTSRRSSRASAITSVPSRSPRAAGWTRRARASAAAATTTPRSCSNALADRLAEAGAEWLHEQRAARAVGLRAGRDARQRRADRGDVPGHPAGARLSGAARPHGEAHDLPAARRRAAAPACT